MKTVAIIGAGAAGLMAAEILSQTNMNVMVYDTMPSAGRKFLMAGKGGLNISHSENFATFVTRYGARQNELAPYLKTFTPTDLCEWLHDLGIETFVGTSGRIFPKEMKAAPLLRAWLHRLRSRGVQFSMRHRWLGWQNNDTKQLVFDTPNGKKIVNVDAVILALGGGSWARLGSTGEWVSILRNHGLNIETLQPSNCGFNVAWREYFQQRFAGQPLKNVCLKFGDFQKKGDVMLTENGIEGGLIYAASALIRDEIFQNGTATIYLDLFPDKTHEALMEKLNKPRGKLSTAQFWRRQLGLEGVKAGLVREVLDVENFNSLELVCQTLKALPLTMQSPRPIDEAISSAGGVPFDELNNDLMCKKLDGVFCAGEMLDWEAPTGGYLLTACLATGWAAGFGVINWNKAQISR
jgi:uncharacterized flavoprotein (TIGR03862 family)